MTALTDWAASILEVDEEILVPVRKLWKQYPSRPRGMTLDEFTRALQNDARFEFMKGVDHTKGVDGEPEEELEEHIEAMEVAGFFSGPRVKMKNREITPQHVAKMLKKHTDRMMESLWAAYDVRPEDLSGDEGPELLDLIARAKEFQLKVQDAFPPPHQDKSKDEREDSK